MDTIQVKPGKQNDTINFVFENCFKAGFGTLSKSDLDLILFTAIMKFCEQDNLSDHALSKTLQITQQKVRTLKEKVSVKYLPITRETAIEIFIEKAQDAKLDEKYIDIPLNDIAVKNEIEAILDDNNILLHTQLNPKIFRIRIDDFLELSIQLEAATSPKEDQDEIENRILSTLTEKAQSDKELRDLLTSVNGDIADMTKKTLKEVILRGGISFGVGLLASLIPGGAFLSKPVIDLIETIRDKI